jgi:hypothetical protein
MIQTGITKRICAQESQQFKMLEDSTGLWGFSNLQKRISTLHMWLLLVRY